MGIIWEAYHKGVPLLGVPGITLECFLISRALIRWGCLKRPGRVDWDSLTKNPKTTTPRFRLRIEKKPKRSGKASTLAATAHTLASSDDFYVQKVQPKTQKKPKSSRRFLKFEIMTSWSTSLFVAKFSQQNPSILCEFFEFNGNSWGTAGYLQKKRNHARHGPKLGVGSSCQASSTENGGFTAGWVAGWCSGSADVFWKLGSLLLSGESIEVEVHPTEKSRGTIIQWTKKYIYTVGWYIHSTRFFFVGETVTMT